MKKGVIAVLCLFVISALSVCAFADDAPAYPLFKPNAAQQNAYRHVWSTPYGTPIWQIQGSSTYRAIFARGDSFVVVFSSTPLVGPGDLVYYELCTVTGFSKGNYAPDRRYAILTADENGYTLDGVAWLGAYLIDVSTLDFVQRPDLELVPPAGQNTLVMNRILDWTRLEQLIAEAEAKIPGEYTASSWSNLTTALTAGKSNLGDNTISDEEYETLCNDLRSALDSLVLKPDKSALAALVARCRALDPDAYESGYPEMLPFLESAEAVLQHDDASPLEVSHALGLLQLAVSRLRAKNQTVTGEMLNPLADQIRDAALVVLGVGLVLLGLLLLVRLVTRILRSMSRA